MNPIPDHIKKGLSILFIGFNPSIRSSETGHHYANPSNRFWTILHKAGLTERKFNPSEDGTLLETGYGFTNIVPRPTRNAQEITAGEYSEGREILMEKISFYRPKIACFVGKGVYQHYSKRRNVAWGEQNNPIVPGTIEFVAPSSSGLVRMSVDDIAAIYTQMKDLLKGSSRC
ncbi:G/U mismatch-specific DNA glycosylase [Siminovitchia terrae]|uniref:G/U mismatch-specific DNA glycosylase n=1 Tax=Siminovitchia terrae TaxID=1914933 RepID=A0ABQ4KW32_SIMTE|nr:mismatch-specific DNA-glycosylase [Siminovitchia terrae]GIN93925.1 G/U mismatch-specific DNA glycosylase [Siminovitchia terrae]GIN96241.1 G/U mismatch-specific DNA glycosylase [Siminovitchia terrae]